MKCSPVTIIKTIYRLLTGLLTCTILCCSVHAQEAGTASMDQRFKKNTITTDFISEGVAVADVNNDGKADIIAGAYWFESPRWVKHSIAQPQVYAPATEFSNSFLNFSLDVNQDGWVDQIRISLPGEEAVWYENPGNKPGYWIMRTILSNAGNESPAFVDVDGNGRADLVCNDPIAKEMIWMKSPSAKGDTLWKRCVIASGDMPATNRYAHGLGLIDMNADGRKDVVVISGWWECPVNPTQSNWVFHAAALGEECSQIYALDLQGNGTNELITASAHHYGIWWHEKTAGEKGNPAWLHHSIFNKFSQSHGLALADVNGDGEPDLITGKRYFAHNGKDPGALEPAVLYWFEYKPGKKPVWIPHLIDDNSGVGLQVLVQDINQDKRVDIIVANKKGVFVFEQQPRQYCCFVNDSPR
ncbi:MAG: FG-GAP-like repeat-containing protein [Chitinophagaceae bacterium]